MRIGPSTGLRRSSLRQLHLVIAAVLCIACGADDRGDGTTQAGGGPVLVFAASDLRDALTDLARTHRASGGDSLVLVFGSTGDLATQIRNGAPADIFFAANAKAIDDLAARGQVIDSTRAVYAIGRLAVIARCASTASTASTARDAAPASCRSLSLTDLAGATIRTVAIADPSHAPYGLAARQALERSGLWARVQPKVVMGANISQAEQFVATGNADAGVVALSLALRTPGRAYTLVDSALHDPLRQTVAVVAGSARPDAAVRFLTFTRSDTGTAIMRRYGFTTPPVTTPAAASPR